MSLETISMKSLSNKFIQPVGNAQIQLPSNINSDINNDQTIYNFTSSLFSFLISNKFL
jgi:hypothetical protein